jgi:outer membrane protein TolC
MQILDEAYRLANERYIAMKRTAELGDRPEIDVVESQIQVQNRESMLRNFETEFMGTRYKLETYLWNEQLLPLELDSLTLPQSMDSVSGEIAPVLTNQLIDSAVTNHPYLQITDFKIKSLEIERKFKKEQLKPEFTIQYNFLNQPIQNNPFTNMSLNNYKWGITFEIPVFLRKERGELAKTNLKLQDEKYNLENSRAYLEFKIKNAWIEYKNALVQLEIFEKTVIDSKRLLEAEIEMFDTGESSLFLINARELAYIQAKLKWVESTAKSKQAFLSLKFNLAQLV